MQYKRFVFGLLLASFLSVNAYAEVYKCTINGAVTFSGTPCEAGPPVKIKRRVATLADLNKRVEAEKLAEQTKVESDRVKALGPTTACAARGVAYFKEIGSFPRLISTGQRAEVVALDRCVRSVRAF